MAQGFPTRMNHSDRNVIDLLFSAKRFGQKNNLGFYCWQRDGKGRNEKSDDPTVDDLLATMCAPRRVFTDEEITARMIAPMLYEVVLCLEEQIIASPAEADMALVYGLGFPPFRGGAFRYLDTIGNDSAIALSERCCELGPLYQAPVSLDDKKKSGALWYPQAKPFINNELKMG